MSKEGTIMRVHSTYEVNTHQQYNPFIPKDADSASVGRQTSGLSFAEHLRLHFQQPTVPAASNGAENLMAIAGTFWGFYPGLKVQTKPETTLEGSTS